MPSLLRPDLQLNTMATPVCISLGIISLEATATLGAILDRHANDMPHKSRVLPSGEKVIAKVLPASFKWKDQIPLVDYHLLIVGCLLYRFPT